LIILKECKTIYYRWDEENSQSTGLSSEKYLTQLFAYSLRSIKAYIDDAYKKIAFQ
jgi:hypothetical protein